MSSLRRALNSHWLSNQNISGSKIVDLGSGSIPAKKWVHNMTFDTYVTVDIQEKFNPDVVMEALGIAGRYVGIGDWRPAKKGKFGKFQVVYFKEKKE